MFVGRGRVLRYALPLVVTLLLAPFAAVAHAQAGADLWSSPSGRQRVFQAVVDVFEQHYWDPAKVDWTDWASRYRDAVLSADSRSAFDGAFRRMVADIHDDHSNWLGPSGGGNGAGARQAGLGMVTTFAPGAGLVIDRVLATSPAAAAGLHRGDVIERIVDAGGGDSDLRSVSDGAARAALAAAIGDGDMTLGVRRAHSAFRVDVRAVDLPFAELELEPSGYMLDAATGYIFIPSFTRGDTAAHVHALLRDLQEKGARSLVLDLRGNRGGSLNQLGLVLGAFLRGTWAKAVSRGEVVWDATYSVQNGVGVSTLVRTGGGTAGVARLDAPTSFDGHVVVLVDHRNSSAGEIAALALAHLGRAQVVGEATSGNVEAVRGFDLPDGSVVMVAVANMEAPDGASFDGGVQPSVIASASMVGLARGYDEPVAAAQALLQGLPFQPGRVF